MYVPCLLSIMVFIAAAAWHVVCRDSACICDGAVFAIAVDVFRLLFACYGSTCRVQAWHAMVLHGRSSGVAARDAEHYQRVATNVWSPCTWYGWLHSAATAGGYRSVKVQLDETGN